MKKRTDRRARRQEVALFAAWRALGLKANGKDESLYGRIYGFGIRVSSYPMLQPEIEPEWSEDFGELGLMVWCQAAKLLSPIRIGFRRSERHVEQKIAVLEFFQWLRAGDTEAILMLRAAPSALEEMFYQIHDAAWSAQREAPAGIHQRDKDLEDALAQVPVVKQEDIDAAFVEIGAAFGVDVGGHQ